MAFLDIIKKFLKPKSRRRTLQKQNPLTRQNSIVGDGETHRTAKSQPMPSSPERDSNDGSNNDQSYQRQSYVSRFSMRLEQVRSRRVSEAVSDANSATYLDDISPIKIRVSESCNEKPLQEWPSRSVRESRSDVASVANSAFFSQLTNVPTSDNGDFEVTEEDYDSEVEFGSPNWVPLPVSSPVSDISAQINNESADAFDQVAHRQLDRAFSISTIRAVSGSTCDEESESNGRSVDSIVNIESEPEIHPMTTTPASTSTIRRQSLDNKHCGSTERKKDSFTLPIPDAQFTSKIESSKFSVLSAPEDVSQSNIGDQTDSYSMLPVNTIVDRNPLNKCSGIQNPSVVVDNSPSPVSRPLRSKKEGLAAKLQHRVDSLTSELREANAQNQCLTALCEDLHNCISMNLDYCVKQQTELNELRANLFVVQNKMTKLIAYNQDLQRQNNVLCGRSLSTEYRWKITCLVLEQCHEMLERYEQIHPI